MIKKSIITASILTMALSTAVEARKVAKPMSMKHVKINCPGDPKKSKRWMSKCVVGGIHMDKGRSVEMLVAEGMTYEVKRKGTHRNLTMKFMKRGDGSWYLRLVKGEQKNLDHFSRDNDGRGWFAYDMSNVKFDNKAIVGIE